MSNAEQILNQLGGNKFVAITGAKVFTQGPGVLNFRLPSNFANNGINHVRVVLESNDTYCVRFSKIRGLNCKTIEECDGVYADGLRGLFTAVTGLETSLGTCGR